MIAELCHSLTCLKPKACSLGFHVRWATKVCWPGCHTTYAMCDNVYIQFESDDIIQNHLNFWNTLENIPLLHPHPHPCTQYEPELLNFWLYSVYKPAHLISSTRSNFSSNRGVISSTKKLPSVNSNSATAIPTYSKAFHGCPCESVGIARVEWRNERIPFVQKEGEEMLLNEENPAPDSARVL